MLRLKNNNLSLEIGNEGVSVMVFDDNRKHLPIVLPIDSIEELYPLAYLSGESLLAYIKMRLVGIDNENEVKRKVR